LDGKTRAIHYNQWRLRWVNKHFVLKAFADHSRMAKRSWVGHPVLRVCSRLNMDSTG
jgi:hypothetical protein